MKYIYLLFFNLLSIFSINAQSISPSTSSEFCPNVDIVFTVTVPGTNPTVTPTTNAPTLIQGPYNIVLLNGNTTFNFRGRFKDLNINQVFQVGYTTQTNTLNENFSFKRIKSLFYSNISTAFPPCNTIAPVQTQPIVFPRCQITSATISFTNVKWFTAFENPELCFGTVTDYEYLLPSGWKLGSIVSDGSTWISGTNSATVTSDLGTGDGVDIKIRASNKTCGSGLINNGPISTVKISRPAPTLTITGSPIICSTNGNYTISGIPNGATVNWSLSNTNLATINGSTTGTTVNVSSSSNYSTVNLIATVTHCTYTYTKVFPIQLGSPVTPAITEVNAAPYPGGPIDVRSSISNGATITSHKWYIDGYLVSTQSGPPEPLVTLSGGGGCGSHSIYLQLFNNCGSNNSYSFLYNRVCGGGGFDLLISPNPASENLSVELTQTDISKNGSKSEIRIAEIVNNFGLTVYKKNFSGKVYKISIPVNNLKNDSYTLRIYDGTEWTSKKILIKH